MIAFDYLGLFIVIVLLVLIVLWAERMK